MNDTLYQTLWSFAQTKVWSGLGFRKRIDVPLPWKAILPKCFSTTSDNTLYLTAYLSAGWCFLLPLSGQNIWTPALHFWPGYHTQSHSTQRGHSKLSRLCVTLSIFLLAEFLPHSRRRCSLMLCSSLPKWIILSMAAWLPPHSCLLDWADSTSAEPRPVWHTTWLCYEHLQHRNLAVNAKKMYTEGINCLSYTDEPKDKIYHWFPPKLN